VKESDEAPGQHFLQQEFPVTSITRADLLSAGCSQEQVYNLSDEDMRAIASKLEDLYCENGLWEDIAFVVDVYSIDKGWKQETDDTAPKQTGGTNNVSL